MARKPQPGTDLTHHGQNLIRVVIASYFIAISLGLIPGTDGAALTGALMPEPAAGAVAAVFMFVTANLVLMGMLLRVAALLLALLVFWSSFLTNLGLAGPARLDVFWQDLVMVAALMLTYLQPGSRTTRRRAMLRWHRKVRKVSFAKSVAPKRIAPRDAPPAVPVFRRAEAPRPIGAARQHLSEPEENIFREDQAFAAAS